jgi:hypothetical protein
VCVDIPDPDNKALVLAATSPRSGMNVIGVSIVGRPVAANREDPITSKDPRASAEIRKAGAAQFAGMLKRAGRGHIPVFEGLIAPYTVVPHVVHIDEINQDLMNDRSAERLLAGGIAEAADLLASTDGPVHFVCGGPLSDVAYFMRDKRLKSGFGMLSAQLGNFSEGDVENLAGGRKQFNVACDPEAAHEVLFNYPGAVVMVPTEITRHSRLGFRDPDDLITSLLRPSVDGSASEETLKLQLQSMEEGLYELRHAYKQVFPLMMASRGEQIYVHDIHPAILMSYLLPQVRSEPRLLQERSKYGMFWSGPYLIGRVTITAAPHTYEERGRWGEIDVVPSKSDEALRFVVRALMTSATPRLERDMKYLLTALPPDMTMRQLLGFDRMVANPKEEE